MANIFKDWVNKITNKSVVVPFSPTTATAFRVFGDFFQFSIGTPGATQYTKTYGSHPLVYPIVNKIATNSAAIERIAENENGDRLKNSAILDLLAKPNPDQTQTDFYEDANESLLLTGNIFIRYIEGIGAGKAIRVLKPQCVEVLCNNSGIKSGYRYTDPKTGMQTTLTLDEVLQVRTSNIVNIDSTQIEYGLSPLQAGWIVVKSSGEKFKAEASIFKNRGIIGILTNKSNTPMLKKERERLQGEFDDEIGGADKYNKIKISASDLNYIQTGMSPTDLKLLEGIVSSLRWLCNLYGISSILFNDNDNSTYNNVSEAKPAAYVDSYIPVANKIDSKLSIFLSDKLNVNEVVKVDLTSIDVLKAATNKVIQSINSLPNNVAGKVIDALSVNNVLTMLGLDEIGEDGNILLGSIKNQKQDENEGNQGGNTEA